MYAVGADIVEFQAFLFEDRQLKKGDFQLGSMLTVETAESEEELEETKSRSNKNTMKKHKQVPEIDVKTAPEAEESGEEDGCAVKSIQESLLFEVDEQKASEQPIPKNKKDNGPAIITNEDLSKYFKIN